MTAATPPPPPGHRRRTVQPVRKRHRVRFWVLITLGVVFVGLVALGVDLYVRYLPAARALKDGQTVATQAKAILDGGVANLDAAHIDQLNTLLTQAQADFGSKSRIIGSSWLLDIAGHLPWLGDQVAALRGLRATGAAGAQLGLDFTPVLQAVRPQAAGGASGPALARLTAFASTQGAVLDRLLQDLDAVDAAAASIPARAGLLGPLSSGRSLLQSLVPKLDAVRPAIGLLRVLPLAAGAGSHRYLLLLDNPGEERPGGGFIGAVGEVTLSQGAITSSDFRVSDFANPLVTSIPAPAPLDQTLFHGKPWELSDSNWSPDFPTSAAEAAHFYQLATGVSVDGVIGVDPIALGYVLGVTGAVPVPGYTQTVDPGNALLVLNEIINKARPGDPGKVYLAPFGQAVLQHILAAPLAQEPGIVAALLRAAEEKHLVLFFNDATLMARADGAGFTGRVQFPPSDALQVIDANVGGNKGDLFVTRSFALTASVGAAGQVTDTLVLQYHDVAQTDPALKSLVAQYGGEYHDYLRVYVPETASLLKMTLQGSGAAAAVSPAGVDFELQRESIDYLLVVPAGGTETLTLTYSGPFADPSLTPAAYALVWTKEIGAPASPISLSLTDGKRQLQANSDLNVDRSWSLAGG